MAQEYKDVNQKDDIIYNPGEAINWDDVNDRGERMQLVEGTYEFTVRKVEYKVDTKQAGVVIPMYNVTFQIDTVAGTTNVMDFFRLTHNLLWKIKSLFAAVGSPLSGNVAPDFDSLVGKKGRAAVTLYDHPDKNNSEIMRHDNNMGYYLAPDDPRQTQNNDPRCKRVLPENEVVSGSNYQAYQAQAATVAPTPAAAPAAQTPEEMIADGDLPF